MPRITEQTKERQMELVWLRVKQRPHGISEQEIADATGIQRRTVNNYLNDLSLEGKVEKQGRLWFLGDYEEIRSIKLEVTPEEAFTYYLGSRLFVKQHDKRNRLAEKALMQLADALSANKLVGQEIAQAAHELAQRPGDPKYEKVFQKIVSGYLQRRSVGIRYKPLNGKPFDTTFDTYLMEPSAIGYATYIIGHSHLQNQRRAYKLERIEEAEILQEAYRIPDDFPGLEILRNSWSIIMGEETVKVVLRFSPQVKERVRETQWHPSQQDDHDETKTKDDWLLWWVQVADTMDMLPWIRGWGKDCEVIEPGNLRKEFARTAVELGKLYQTVSMTKFAYHLPYAKTNPDNENEVHLLLYHLIDVGLVALAIWQSALTESIKQRLAGTLGLSIIQTGQFIAFIAALHDLGKAFPGYQKKYGPSWLQAELKKAGLGLEGITGDSYKKEFPHGTVSTWALSQLLPQVIGIDAVFAEQIAVAIGGHHGSWPPPGTTERLNDSKYPRWDEVRRDLVWEVQAVFQPPINVALPVDKGERNIFLTLLSGLVSVADWLGSRNKECFGFIGEPMTTRQYVARSAHHAQQSLQDLGWLGWLPTNQTLTFAETFAYLNFAEPRGVQAAVIEAAQTLQPPTLLIVEAPTGIGKTEIALFIADTWLQQSAGRGLYVAMPTQATSNQMYERVGKFLQHRYPDFALNYHLVHGQAAWQDELKAKVELQTVGDDKTNGIQAESWFAPRKRTLLAPFSVGTVDQTLLSILQTHHFFVRLFGLSHKVVIFDEVHAYDTFMSTLFHRLLQWLNAIGTSVIILSATLPKVTRRELVKAYTGQELPDKLAYPALTIAPSISLPVVHELPKPADVTLELCWEIGREPTAILAYLQKALAHGGCIAVICNTVGRAQAIFTVLEDARQNGKLDLPEADLILFHARFPPVWRQAIEADVLEKFGKPDTAKRVVRPLRAIVVATQVIEQSLDLDFDLMVIDLAPVDLVIQRAGRLHRHQRDAQQRHGHPRRLVITEPSQDDNGIPDFGSDEWVYEPAILLRTYLALHGKATIAIPTDTPTLIEAVYGDTETSTLSPNWQTALHTAQKAMEHNRREAIRKAAQQLVRKPDDAQLLKQRNANLDEESPDVHETFRAQTRDIDPGIALVCLHREGGQLILYTPNGKKALHLETKPSHDLVKWLQQNSITLQHKGLLSHFLNEQPPPSWRETGALRHCRPVIFENGWYEHPTLAYQLHLSQKFGLQIIKKEGA